MIENSANRKLAKLLITFLYDLLAFSFCFGFLLVMFVTLNTSRCMNGSNGICNWNELIWIDNNICI